MRNLVDVIGELDEQQAMVNLMTQELREARRGLKMFELDAKRQIIEEGAFDLLKLDMTKIRREIRGTSR